MKHELASLEISLVDWSSYAESSGGADTVGERLRELLEAPDSKAAERVYWTLENRVVAQTTVYSVAEPVTSVLMAALTEPRPIWVTSAVMDLLCLFLGGAPASNAPEDVVARCHARIAQGYWLLVGEALDGHCAEGALEVLEALDASDARLPALRRATARGDQDGGR